MADKANMWKHVTDPKRRWLAILIVLGLVASGMAIVVVQAHKHKHTVASTETLASSQASTVEGEAPEPATGGSCTSRHIGGDIEVTFYGDGRSPCESFDRSVATAGQFWQVILTAMRVHPLCSMSKGSLSTEVRYSGLAGEAERLCAHFAATGWTEAEGPGEQAEAEKARKEAEQKAAQERERLAERAEEASREAVEDRRRETREKVERTHEEAQQKQEEARQKAQEQDEERKNQEEQRRSEEETRRSESEAEATS